MQPEGGALNQANDDENIDMEVPMSENNQEGPSQRGSNSAAVVKCSEIREQYSQMLAQIRALSE
jgi:hypothetical protein